MNKSYLEYTDEDWKNDDSFSSCSEIEIEINNQKENCLLIVTKNGMRRYSIIFNSMILQVKFCNTENENGMTDLEVLKNISFEKISLE
ncbi:MAG: hypothetical protein PHD66_02865 [Eubacteriales bacterium]|jgi:hypothetical protein|nr:hypothetical protein [Eubacteriales bacterium]